MTKATWKGGVYVFDVGVKYQLVVIVYMELKSSFVGSIEVTSMGTDTCHSGTKLDIKVEKKY